MMSLPSRPDETFDNDYTRRPALGEWRRGQFDRDECIRRPDALLNVFFYNGRTGCLLRLWEGFERRG
jgi:hypothetical protein